MTVYRFEEIKQKAKKRVPCDNCGTKVNRQKTFTMTENPFNRNPDGTVRNRYEIREALLVKAREWQAKQDGELCASCYKAKWFPQESA
jgi:hypothetical protein